MDFKHTIKNLLTILRDDDPNERRNLLRKVAGFICGIVCIYIVFATIYQIVCDLSNTSKIETIWSSLPYSFVLVYFFGLNAYVLLTQERDTHISGKKKIVFYAVEVLICSIIASLVQRVFPNTPEVLGWSFAVAVIVLTQFFPAKKLTYWLK